MVKGRGRGEDGDHEGRGEERKGKKSGGGKHSDKD